MKPLTEKQQKVYDYLVAFHRREDRLPSTREIAKNMGFFSQTSSVTFLKTLEKKGKLEKRGGYYRFADREKQDFSLMHEIVFVFAARYAHDRNTGGALSVVTAIKESWGKLSAGTQEKLLKEAEEATCNFVDWNELKKLPCK